MAIIIHKLKKRLNAFKIQNRIRMFILITTIQHCTDSNQFNKIREEIKDIWIRNEEIKLHLFIDDLIVYIKKS